MALLSAADRGFFFLFRLRQAASKWNCSVSFIACHGFYFSSGREAGSSRGVSPGPWSPQVLAHLAHRPLLCVWVGSAVETEQVVKLVGARGCCSGLGLSAPAPSDERNMTPLLLPWDLLVRDVFFLFFLPSPRTRAVRGGLSLSRQGRPQGRTVLLCCSGLPCWGRDAAEARWMAIFSVSERRASRKFSWLFRSACQEWLPLFWCFMLLLSLFYSVYELTRRCWSLSRHCSRLFVELAERHQIRTSHRLTTASPVQATLEVCVESS